MACGIRWRRPSTSPQEELSQMAQLPLVDTGGETGCAVRLPSA